MAFLVPLIGGSIGALSGWAIGGTSAISLGWTIGSTAARLLFPAQQQPEPTFRTEGPRLSDLTVSSSAYGDSIAVVYGTCRVGSEIIWSTGIREEQRVERVSGGGGGKK